MPTPDVTVELKQEEGCSDDPAFILVYLGKQLVAKVIAKVEGKKGADGGFYPCVTLTLKKGKLRES